MNMQVVGNVQNFVRFKFHRAFRDWPADTLYSSKLLVTSPGILLLNHMDLFNIESYKPEQQELRRVLLWRALPWMEKEHGEEEAGKDREESAQTVTLQYIHTLHIYKTPHYVQINSSVTLRQNHSVNRIQDFQVTFCKGDRYHTNRLHLCCSQQDL